MIRHVEPGEIGEPSVERQRSYERSYGSIRAIFHVSYTPIPPHNFDR